MKKISSLLIFSFSVLLFAFPSCTAINKYDIDSNKITVVASLFPQYDFVRQIAKDKVNILLLLPAGSEVHTFDPSPADIAQISSADIFVYTNEEMEPWADKIIKSVKSDTLNVVKAGEGAMLESEHEEHEEHEHDHDHEHSYDPHVWLNLENSCVMVDNIAAALVSADAPNKSFYLENAEEYKQELLTLDKSIETAVSLGNKGALVFGGRFAYSYFLCKYNLQYISAYDSCSEQAEPSLKKMTEIISFVKENNISVIYYEELSNPKVARIIAEETGAQCLLFSTAHNVTRQEFSDGITFVGIMKNNLENIKKGLEINA